MVKKVTSLGFRGGGQSPPPLDPPLVGVGVFTDTSPLKQLKAFRLKTHKISFDSKFPHVDSFPPGSGLLQVSSQVHS